MHGLMSFALVLAIGFAGAVFERDGAAAARPAGACATAAARCAQEPGESCCPRAWRALCRLICGFVCPEECAPAAEKSACCGSGCAG